MTHGSSMYVCATFLFYLVTFMHYLGPHKKKKTKESPHREKILQPPPPPKQEKRSKHAHHMTIKKCLIFLRLPPCPIPCGRPCTCRHVHGVFHCTLRMLFKLAHSILHVLNSHNGLNTACSHSYNRRLNIT